ncbi:MAG: putative membrane protein YfcA [Bradymonadia bacterium]|jgi:uncharacterized membrane protein YfcA
MQRESSSLFGLIGVAGLNRTLDQDQHCRGDGRSGMPIFLQMMIIAPLAAFTGGAAGADAPAFATTYSILLLVIISLWLFEPRVDNEQRKRLSGEYIASLTLAAGFIVASALIPEAHRIGPGRGSSFSTSSP